MKERDKHRDTSLQDKRQFESVLIGTSLTLESNEVVRSALAVTRALGARVRLIHVLSVEPIAYGFDGVFAPDILETLKEQEEANLADQIRETGVFDRELISADIVMGAPHQALALAARSTGADLIIVGAAEGHGPTARLLGSTADRVIRSAHCPVLILRNGLSLPPPRVLAPVDLSRTSGLAVETGTRFLKQMGADESTAIEALFVLSPIQRQMASQFSPEQIDRMAKEELLRFTFEHTESWDGTIETKVRVGEARHQLLKNLEEDPVDLIVVGSHGHGTLRRALIGSVAGRLAHRASCSVLFVPHEEEASMVEESGVEFGRDASSVSRARPS